MVLTNGSSYGEMSKKEHSNPNTKPFASISQGSMKEVVKSLISETYTSQAKENFSDSEKQTEVQAGTLNQEDVTN